METKTCTKCGEAKPLSMFSKVCDGTDRVRAACKPCVCVASMEWQKRTADIRREKKRIYALCNKNVAAMAKSRDAKRIKNLSDSYVLKALRAKFNSQNIPPEIIAIQREKIQIKRLAKQLNQAIKDAQK